MSTLTWADININGTDEQLRNRPELRGSLQVQWQPADGLQVGFSTLYVGRVHDSSVPTGNRELNDYVRVDFTAAWRANRHLEFYLAVDNLFDTQYEEYVGFPGPRIAPRAGIVASL